MPSDLISGISHRFQWLSQRQGQVTHVLLTRSPLIHPASWASTFDLHVLSTPPAFVLSQNQTLRQCQMALHRRNGKETDNNKETPEEAFNSASKNRTTNPRRRAGILASTPRPTTHEPHPKHEAEPTDDEPSRHRLLGTLLSSQRTDAHPDQAHTRTEGNRSNLPESAPPVKPAVQRPGGCSGLSRSRRTATSTEFRRGR